MKKKLRFTFVAIPALGIALFTASTRGESDAEARANGAAIAEVVAQQKALTENQTRIDTKLAEISEELRLARIFVSRSGGKK